MYQPFPAYSPRPNTQSVHSVAPHTAISPSKLTVIATHKPPKRTVKRDREERKEQQPADHTRAPSSAFLPATAGRAAVDEEEKQADDDDEDEDDGSFSEEQQRLTEEEDIARSWVEFIDPKSSTRVYINVRTGAMSWDRPAAMADDDDEDDETDDNRGRTGKQSGGGTRVENEDGSVVGDELSDLFTLTSIPPARVLSSLRHIDSAMEQLVAKAVNLPPPLLASLSTARTQLTESVSQLSAIVLSAERSPVETLIAYDTLPWSFSSSAASFASIDYYRASASLLHANDPLPSAPTSHYPVYLSSAPLPAHLRQYAISVRLHSDDDHSVPRFLSLTVSDKDSAVSVVKHCMYKGLNRLTGERGGGAATAGGGWEGGVDNHVLKAVGSEEYMLGERPMFEYEYVRQRMRDGEDVQLVIVRKQPQPPPQSDAAADSPPLAVQYQKKVNRDIIPLSRTSYSNLSLRSPLASQPAFSTYDTHLPFRYKVSGLDHMSSHTLPLLASSYASYPSFVSFSLRSFLFHGTARVADSNFTTPDQPLPCSSVRYGSWHTCPSVMLDSFPRGLRLAFLLYGRREDGKELMLAWLVKQLVDEGGEVLRGRRVFKLWSIKPETGKKKHGKDKDDMTEANIFRATTADNECDRECVRLTVDFQDFALPLVYPLFPVAARPANKTMVTAPATLAKAQQKQLDDILTKDALYPFTAADMQFIWQHRQHMTRVPHALPTFLHAVNWQLVEQRQEAYRLLREWTPFYSPLSALLLLDCKYADAVVREHAVTIIRRLPDDQLALYLLQLVQCLKYEHYHHSPLSALLVQRAVASPIVIGQPLFWHLKNELHEPYHCERFVLLLEEMLSFCPLLCVELSKQVSMVSRLTKVSEMVQRLKRDGLHDHEVEKEYHKELHKLNADFFSQIGYFLSPLHPKKRCMTLVVEKCRYMSSKMVPLWLTFRNADPYTHQHPVQQHGRQSSHTVTAAASQPSANSSSSSSISAPTTTPHPAEYVVMMFKSGDDLRQDILTLQLLRYMDCTWLDAAIDLRIKPYAVVATGVNEHGDGIGLIDIVLNSETTSGIQLNPKYGGGTTGAFKLDPIDSFIRFHNKGNVAVVDAHTHEMTVKPAYELAVENFVHSCAGYCVATFVLGIGDRHNGNIMVTKRGHLFHIDFGQHCRHTHKARRILLLMRKRPVRLLCGCLIRVRRAGCFDCLLFSQAIS